MDFLRSSVKALFTEYPLNIINCMFSEDNTDCADSFSGKENHLRGILTEVLRHTQKSFTTSNIESLVEIIADEWLINNDAGLTKDISVENRLLLLPAIAGKKMLNLGGELPTVKFDQLLRWRDLTFNVSEDLLIIPALAEHDNSHGIDSRDLLWDDTLPHDAEWLNEILKQGLWDIHAHLSSSAAPALFNWIDFMNHPEKVKRIEKSYYHNRNNLSMAYDPIAPFGSQHWTLSKWIIFAAYIRSELFQRIYGAKAINEIWRPSLNEFDCLDEKVIIETIGNSVRTLNMMNEEGCRTLRTCNDIAWDYALNEQTVSNLDNQARTNPLMTHYGERRLMYDFFRGYFNGTDGYRDLGKFVWLYLLVKNKFRREIIATNNLSGFINFQKYFSYKDISHKRDNSDRESDELAAKFNDISYRYAIQTSVGRDRIHGLETRSGIGDLRNIRACDYNKSIFFSEKLFDKDDCNLSVVIHLMKNNSCAGCTPAKQKDKYKEDIKKISKIIESNNHISCNPHFVGIDACSNELSARPYIFGSIFRDLYTKGIKNQTFHVGEDFHDLIDGLRAIDEAVRHLPADGNIRLGHALALGIDAHKYYVDRHFTAVLPQQVLLDNMVWLRFTLENSGREIPDPVSELIDHVFKKYIEEIKYMPSDGTSVSITEYWESMKMRGFSEEEEIPDMPGQPSPSAKRLHALFMEDATISANGVKCVEIKFPEEIFDVLSDVQKLMRDKICSRGICIECNPTSNLIIGPFTHYREHPIFTMNNPETQENIAVAISTDNKGIMATSIENEYSLIAACMTKHDYNNPSLKCFDKETISGYIKQIQSTGSHSRFTL